METLQTYERMVHILCLKGHDTQKASVKAHLTVKDEFYRETDLFGKKLLWIRSWPTLIAMISKRKKGSTLNCALVTFEPKKKKREKLTKSRKR